MEKSFFNRNERTRRVNVRDEQTPFMNRCGRDAQANEPQSGREGNLKDKQRTNAKI